MTIGKTSSAGYDGLTPAQPASALRAGIDRVEQERRYSEEDHAGANEENCAKPGEPRRVVRRGIERGLNARAGRQLENHERHRNDRAKG